MISRETAVLRNSQLVASRQPNGQRLYPRELFPAASQKEARCHEQGLVSGGFFAFSDGNYGPLFLRLAFCFRMRTPHGSAHRFVPDLRGRDLVMRRRMGIYGRGHVNVGVAQSFADGGQRDSEAEQLGTVGVPYRVQRDACKSGFLCDPARRLRYRSGAYEITAGLAENEVEVRTVIKPKHPQGFDLFLT